MEKLRTTLGRVQSGVNSAPRGQFSPASAAGPVAPVRESSRLSFDLNAKANVVRLFLHAGVGLVVVAVQRHSEDGFCKGGRGDLFLFILMKKCSFPE